MMRKKSAARRSLVAKPETHVSTLKPQNDNTKDLFLHARSFHIAAKKLAGTLEFGSGPFAGFDVAPVVFLYRHALELHLKAIILGEGGNFLGTRPDVISVSNSHSVSWLAQFVCQIVTAVGWEKEFRSEGVQSFADFKALVGKVNTVDPGMYVFRSPVDPRSQVAVQNFTRKLDLLLELLERTADALAAEWDLRHENVEFGDDGPGAGGAGGTTMIQ
jgi:hypothetical protein